MRLIPIARAKSPHGVKGWFKIALLTDRPERFRAGLKVFLESGSGEPLEYTVSDFQAASGAPRILLEGIDSRGKAAEHSGCFICVAEDDVPPIDEEDAYYTYQIMGMRVVDVQGKELGRITNIFSTGGNDIYVVTGEGKKEHYLPALKAAIRKVDVEAGEMVADPDWLT